MNRFGALMMAAILVFTVAGCTTESTTDDPQPANQKLTSEQVTFGEQLSQIRGHHLAAMALYGSGDEKGAATHTGHPVEELLASVESDVRDEDEKTAATLGPALRAASLVVAREGSVEDLQTAVDKAADVLDRAEDAVAGDLQSTTRYRASVVAALLATVNGEYGEAVQDGKVSLLAEWQDGYAFFQIAKGIYGDIEDDVRAADAEEADEIEEAIETLDGILSDIAPPASPRAGDEVERATTLIGAELKGTVDALVIETVEPEETFDNIDALLTQILEAYEAGNTEEASELAAEAYLENYELVEADVIHLAPEVNEELEPLLGAELRKKIGEGVPVSEIESMIDRARTLLKQAREAVLEG